MVRKSSTPPRHWAAKYPAPAALSAVALMALRGNPKDLIEPYATYASALCFWVGLIGFGLAFGLLVFEHFRR